MSDREAWNKRNRRGRPAGKSQGAASAGEPPEVSSALTAHHSVCTAIASGPIIGTTHQCDLPDGHDGDHRKVVGPFCTLTWDRADRVDAEDQDNTTDRTYKIPD